MVFAGNGVIYENGTLLASSERFSFGEQVVISEIDVEHIRTERRVNTTFAACHANCAPEIPVRISTEYVNSGDLNLTRTFEPHPFVPQGPVLDERCEEVFSIQVSGLAQRLVHTNAKSAVVGISGGLDSTLALLVCVKTFDKLGWDRKGIIGVTMPGFGTTDRTHTNAVDLMTSLGVTMREVCIKDACIQHFKDIDHDINVHDVVYENSQARERTQILMDIANQTWGMVVGTGDLSELALGWATYNGDHMSMYGVNSSIPKTLVKHLVKWVAENDMDEASRATLLDIVDTPISPELIPADENGNIKQITEDLVGPYELHDFFLYHFFRYGCPPAKILHLAETAFAGQYDRATLLKWLRTFFRRFFQQFEQGILRRSVHVLRMANEKNAAVAVARIHGTFRSNAACSIHFNFRIARINAGDIGMIILLDLSAGGTLSARLFSRALTQQCHRQHACRGQLADAFRTGQQNALRKASVQGMLPSCFQFFISQQTGKRHDGSAFPQKSPSITQMDAVSVYHPSRRNSM